MTIPPEIIALANQLYRELEQIEQETTRGLEIFREFLSKSPENSQLISFFAYLTNVIFFINNSRRRIQTAIEDVSGERTTAAEIQESGEDLATLLGTIIEIKVEVREIILDLENLP